MWYALVHDEQLGPMPDTELAELHLQGVISDETLVWTATMSDWRPVSEVAEIQALLADPDLYDDEEEGEGATMMMAAGDADWAAVLAGGLPKAPEQPIVELDTPAVSVQRDPVPQAPTEVLDPDMLADDLLQPLNEPAERRGILGPPLPGPPLPAPEPSMPYLGGVDDEPGEGSIIDRFPDAPPVLDEPAMPDFGAPADVAAPAGEDGGTSKVPLILLLLLLGGGGAAVWFLVIDKPGDPVADAGVAVSTDAPTTNAPATGAPASVASARPATAPSVAAVVDAGVGDAMVIALEDLEPEAPVSAAPATQAPGSVASAAPATKAAPTSVAAVAPASKKAPRTSRPRRPKSPSTRAPRRPRDRSPKTRAPRKPAGDLPVQLSRAHIVSVLQRSGGRLRSCASLDEKVKEGTFSVNVVIKRSGVVHSAKVVTGRLRKSPAAKCIEGQVKRFRFGAFTGDPMRIQLPFKL